MTGKQRRLIEEAFHSTDICDEWHEKIKKTFPDIIKENELIQDTWYACGDYFMTYYKKGLGNYGFNASGTWMEASLGTANKDKFVKMTNEEVKYRLIEEARRRGLVSGVKIQTSWCDDPFVIGELWEYGSNVLYCDSDKRNAGTFTIFQDGEWAVPGISHKRAEKIVKMKIIFDES